LILATALLVWLTLQAASFTVFHFYAILIYMLYMLKNNNIFRSLVSLPKMDFNLYGSNSPLLCCDERNRIPQQYPVACCGMIYWLFATNDAKSDKIKQYVKPVSFCLVKNGETCSLQTRESK